MDINLQFQGIMLVVLKPNEDFYSERGAMMLMDYGIVMKPVDVGFIKGIKRVLAGESFFSMVKYHNKTNSNKTLKLRYDIQSLGWFQQNVTDTNIEMIKLDDFGGDLIIMPGAFFAGTSLKIELFFDKMLSRSIFSFGNLFNQRIIGNGILFIKKDRWMKIKTLELNLNSQINVDPKEVFAFPMSALVQNKASISSFLAGEGFSSYQFIGPAKILLFETNNPNYRGCFTKIVMAVVFYIVLRIVLSILF
jgi:uncharacterized protein (AIM24 family)